MKPLIIAGAFFYLFLIPFFFHPDLKIIYHHAQYLSRGVLDVYSYLDKNPSNLGQFVYPPLAYFFFGLVFPVVNFFAGPDFISWLGMGNSAVAVPHIFRYLFLMKLPLVLFHLATGLVLYKISQKKLVLALWLFNPVSIYVVGVMGQFDIVPVFFTVLALYLFPTRRILAALLLGVAVSLKTYPLLLVPFLGHFGIVSVVLYFLSIVPYLHSPAFIDNVFASGLSQRLFQMGLSVGYDKFILLVPAAILFIYFSRPKIEKGFLAVLLIAVGAIHFHPQWALWPLPFLVLYLGSKRLWWPGVIFILAWMGVTALFPDSFLTWGLLSTLNTEVLTLPPLVQLLPPALPWINLAQTLFFSISAWVAYRQLE